MIDIPIKLAPLPLIQHLLSELNIDASLQIQNDTEF